MMPLIKHRHVIHQNKENKIAIWSIWSDFDDSGYEKSYLIPEKCPTFLQSKGLK